MPNASAMPPWGMNGACDVKKQVVLYLRQILAEKKALGQSEAAIPLVIDLLLTNQRPSLTVEMVVFSFVN